METSTPTSDATGAADYSMATLRARFEASPRPEGYGGQAERLPVRVDVPARLTVVPANNSTDDETLDCARLYATAVVSASERFLDEMRASAKRGASASTTIHSGDFGFIEAVLAHVNARLSNRQHIVFSLRPDYYMCQVFARFVSA